MRLICPNCGAQYAVADDVIPAGGRDVQCSNCAHTWFETPGASANDGVPEARKSRPPVPPAASEPAEDSIHAAFEKAEDTVAPAPKPTVDPSVADILREEAARETAQRRAEAPAPVESQSDLGLQDPAPTPRPVTQGIPTAAATAAASVGAVAAGANGSRRELLPDIEEINSSLRSDAERSDNGDLIAHTTAERERRGFRRGFFLVLLLIAILVAIYVQAENIKTLAPDLAGVMDSYVSTIDAGRIWLDDSVRSILTSVAADTGE